MANTLTTEDIVRLADPKAEYGQADLALLSDDDLLGLHSAVYAAREGIERRADELGCWRHQMPGTSIVIYHRLMACYDELDHLYAALDAERCQRLRAYGG